MHKYQEIAQISPLTPNFKPQPHISLCQSHYMLQMEMKTCEIMKKVKVQQRININGRATKFKFCMLQVNLDLSSLLTSISPSFPSLHLCFDVYVRA